MSHDGLGDRMKRYERVTQNRLLPRSPAVLRVDGKAFHTLTRHMEKPWDHMLVALMQRTAVKLCEEVQGAKLGYVQSDEISVVFTDYDTYDTQGWFDYEVQKIASVAASIATMAFNRLARGRLLEDPQALFDARVFTLPREEICNYLVWRQQDAVRNSVQMLARANFSHKECHGLSCKDLQNKLFTEKGVNWNDYRAHLRRGATVIRVVGRGWEVDYEPPIFSDDRAYVEGRLPQEQGGV